MSGELIQTAAFLQQELQEFFRSLRRSKGDEALIQAAAQRLFSAVRLSEPFGEDPGEIWDSMSLEQRWGYMRIASSLGTAVHELRRLGILA